MEGVECLVDKYTKTVGCLFVNKWYTILLSAESVANKVEVSVKTFSNTKNMIIIKEYILADILQIKGR